MSLNSDIGSTKDMAIETYILQPDGFMFEYISAEIPRNPVLISKTSGISSMKSVR
jgi:hypothetical protein